MHKYQKGYDVPRMFNNTKMPLIDIEGNSVLLTFIGESNGTQLEFKMRGAYA